MVIATKQGAVAQGRAKALHDAALQRDDGLQVDARALSREALHAAECRGESIANAVHDIATGVGRDRLVSCQPPLRLPRKIQLQNRLHAPAPGDPSGPYGVFR